MKLRSWMVMAYVAVLAVASALLIFVAVRAYFSPKGGPYSSPAVVSGPQSVETTPVANRQTSGVPSPWADTALSPSPVPAPLIPPDRLLLDVQHIRGTINPTQQALIWTHPNPRWRISQLRQLTCAENHGMLRLRIMVSDRNGNPIDGVPILVNTMDGRWPSTTVSGIKAPGATEYVFVTADGLGGRWAAEVDGGASDVALNLATDLPDEETPECAWGNTRGRYSYDVMFARVN